MASRVLHCDLCESSTFDSGVRSVSASCVRAWAREDGWIEMFAKDICPVCVSMIKDKSEGRL